MPVALVMDAAFAAIATIPAISSKLLLSQTKNIIKEGIRKEWHNKLIHSRVKKKYVKILRFIKDVRKVKTKFIKILDDGFSTAVNAIKKSYLTRRLEKPFRRE